MLNSANIRSISGFFEENFPILIWFLDYFVSYCYQTKNEDILHFRMELFLLVSAKFSKNCPKKWLFMKIWNLITFWILITSRRKNENGLCNLIGFLTVLVKNSQNWVILSLIKKLSWQRFVRIVTGDKLTRSYENKTSPRNFKIISQMHITELSWASLWVRSYKEMLHFENSSNLIKHFQSHRANCRWRNFWKLTEIRGFEPLCHNLKLIWM